MAFSAVYQKLRYQIPSSHSIVMFLVEKSTTLKETMPLLSAFILLCHRAAPSIISMCACGVAIPLLRQTQRNIAIFLPITETVEPMGISQSGETTELLKVETENKENGKQLLSSEL